MSTDATHGECATLYLIYFFSITCGGLFLTSTHTRKSSLPAKLQQGKLHSIASKSPSHTMDRWHSQDNAQRELWRRELASNTGENVSAPTWGMWPLSDTGYFLILVVRTPIESNNISEQKDMVKAILGNTLKGRLSLTVKEGESRWTKSEDSFLLHMD